MSATYLNRCSTFSAVFLIGALLSTRAPDQKSLPVRNHGAYALDCHYSSFSDQRGYFEGAIESARRQVQRSATTIPHPGGVALYGIVSHHLLIKGLIAEFFLRLSQEIHPRTVVLIGPNHFAQGNHAIAVSRLPWKTPFGMAYPNQELLTELVKSGAASRDEEAFVREHSIGALVPFVRYFFPKASVVTLVVRSDADTEQAAHIARTAAACAGPDVFFLASLDFSHNKPSRVAAAEDDSTLAVLRAFDAAHYQRAYVDSRAALFTILLASRLAHQPSLEIVQHTNSGEITGNRTAPCTSYINAVIRSVPQSNVGSTEP